jgi:class 3 adenylate cyclase
MDTTALVLFTDARGFTSWADNPDVFARLGEFAKGFMGVLRKVFPKKDYFLKPLGDGAMIVRPDISSNLNAEAAAKLLLQTLQLIHQANEEFQQVCTGFATPIGHPADMRLGWGIVRGSVQKLASEDYVGPNVNKSARLCSEARPFGIIIDRDDFSIPPQSPQFKFYPQMRKLKGVEEEVRVWVTEEIATQFLTREQLREVPEVHVAGQCIDTTSKRGLKILIAKRALWRRLYPNLYEGCGGQLAASEDFKDGVARHFRMEMNLEVRVLEDIHCFYHIIKPEEKLIPGIRFLCERISEAEPKSNNHTELKWVSESVFKNISADQFIEGLKDQVLHLIEQYRRSGRR